MGVAAFAMISVLKNPGSTHTTRTPYRPTSSRSASLNEPSACFDAAYIDV